VGRLSTPGQFLLVGLALLLLGLLLLGTDHADAWMGGEVLAVGAVTTACGVVFLRNGD
jgi:hypothetical protein